MQWTTCDVKAGGETAGGRKIQVGGRKEERGRGGGEGGSTNTNEVWKRGGGLVILHKLI